MDPNIDDDIGMKMNVERRPSCRWFTLLGWPAALTIIGIAVLVECVPLVLGLAENAMVNWSFFYVTFRFILLPVACGLHVVVNCVSLLASRSRPIFFRLLDSSSVVLSIAYLYLSFYYPLPFSKPFM